MKDRSLSFTIMLRKASSYKQYFASLFCTMMLFSLYNVLEAKCSLSI